MPDIFYMEMKLATDDDKIWDMMEKIGFCMLATKDGSAIRSRPMAANADRSEGKIFFLTDSKRHKDEEIAASSAVCLSFADPGGQKYVSVSGDAEISRDQSRIRKLWNIAAKAWWNGPDDPDIRVLTVTPNDAEYWDSPGKVVSYVKMAAAAVTGAKPDLGDHKRVAI